MMKLPKLFFAVALLLLGVTNLLATAQAPDKIIFNGKEYRLHSNPMEEYFKKFPEKKPKSDVVSSGLWRGYIATFEITGNALFLKDVEIMLSKKTDNKFFETDWKSVISEVVSDGKKLKIDWVTGLLVLPVGEIVNYVHMGYGSTYEKYILLEIDRGDFKRSKEFDYKEYEKFKERQYEAFKKTEEYKNLVRQMKKDKDTTQEFIDSFLKSYIINYTSSILVD